MSKEKKISVAVLYNHVGEDEYEKIRTVDPSTLDFKPEYNIHVSTIQEEYDAIVKALSTQGLRARAVNIQESLKKLESVLRRNPPDVVFNLVEFFHDESGLEAMIAGLFELHQIPYTGAPPFTLGLCQRKGLTKQALLANGVPTPHFRLFSQLPIPKRLGLRFPLIVKPAREDASTGVEKDSVVYDSEALQQRIEKTFHEFSPPVIVEEYIDGRELHVSILGNDPPLVLPIIEFDFSDLPPDHPRIISYAAKWNPLDEAYHRVHSTCPADLSPRIQKKIEQTSLRAYRITGCRDYARLDLRLSATNQVYVLEVNPNPDLTEGVSFMESAEKGGISFSQTLRRLVEFALERKPPPPPPPAPVPETPPEPPAPQETTPAQTE
jgi:D-alanine-D-alanine ligase